MMKNSSSLVENIERNFRRSSTLCDSSSTFFNPHDYYRVDLKCDTGFRAAPFTTQRPRRVQETY
jgi:hypothetical protein